MNQKQWECRNIGILLFYLTTHISTSLGPLCVTVGNAALTAIPMCCESGSTCFSSM
jgi:hypothetical protein